MVCRSLRQRHQVQIFQSSWIPVLLVLGIYLAPGWCLVRPPEIFPPAEFVNKLVGYELELSCHGDSPVYWNASQISYDDERLNISNSNNYVPRQYSSTFRLENVSHFDVGYIKCFYEDDTTNDDSIYLYVEDAGKLLVGQQKIELLFAVIGSSFVIPCKPTSASVKIEISKDTDGLTLNDNNYSKMEGFKIGNVGALSHGSYECKGSKGNLSETIHFEVHVEISDAHVDKPKINMTTDGSLLVPLGSTLSLSCTVFMSGFFALKWTSPAYVINSERTSISSGFVNESTKEPFEPRLYRTMLTVQNVTDEDSGQYNCTVRRSHKNWKTTTMHVKILPGNETFLNVSTLAEHIEVRKYETAKWVIQIHSFPSATDFSWTNWKGEEISPNYKFFIKKNEQKQEVILSILGATRDDVGEYKFTAVLEGKGLTETLVLSLKVNEEPEPYIFPLEQEYFTLGQNYTLTCKSYGYPLPTLEWFVQSCNDSNTCDPWTSPANLSVGALIIQNQFVTKNVTFTANHHEVYKCEAVNEFKQDFDEKYVKIMDVAGDKALVISPQPTHFQGDVIKLICAASKLNFSESPHWKFWNVPLSEWILIDENWNSRSFWNVVADQSKWTWQSVLTFPDVNINATGIYGCFTSDGTNQTISLTVHPTERPRIVQSNLNSSTAVFQEGEQPLEVTFFCVAEGAPTPQITWLRDGNVPEDWPAAINHTVTSKKTSFNQTEGTLTFRYIREVATGEYKCLASNRLGEVSNEIEVEVLGRGRLPWVVTALIVIFAIIVFVLLGCLAKRKHKEMQWRRNMYRDRKTHFDQGDPEKINPNLPVDDQAYLLPYDSKTWEFPESRLKIGQTVGSGAFGMVMKADAYGIKKSEAVTIVAVKMVKPDAEDTHLKALQSELKIMAHLGQHVNVVNLLGACTTELIKKKRLLVIVEYCKYGSLLSYLHRHQNTFINQVDPVRGIVDSNISYNRVYQSQPKTAWNGYRTLEELKNVPLPPGADECPRQSTDNFLSPHPTVVHGGNDDYVAGSAMHSVCTDMSYVSNYPASVMDDRRRSSCGSSYIGHYRGDYQHREVRPITTSDLLGWAFQTARGMEYLASRKVLHGDLAARNVLLAEHNVAKICDFGLAKDLYKDYKYKKKSEGLLPVKWMAPESISYGVFSTSSDVWSFGIVLWELFTLGKTPYPGMEADDKFLKMLNDGYRMEKPSLAPSSVYELMNDCWCHESSQRPSFTVLADKIGDLMEEGLRQHYIDLNSTYVRSNEAWVGGAEDLLNRMGRAEVNFEADGGSSPKLEHPYSNVAVDNGGYLMPNSTNNASSSAYANVAIVDDRLQRLANNEGYMFMNTDSPGPTEIFSPRPPKPAMEVNNEGYGIAPTTTVTKSTCFDFDNVNQIGSKTIASSRKCTSSPIITIESPNFSPSSFSNQSYIPNNVILSLSSSPKEPADSDNVLSQKRQKTDSGVSSLDSTSFDNKSPTPTDSSNDNNQNRTDSTSDSDTLTSRMSFGLNEADSKSLSKGIPNLIHPPLHILTTGPSDS